MLEVIKKQLLPRLIQNICTSVLQRLSVLHNPPICTKNSWKQLSVYKMISAHIV